MRPENQAVQEHGDRASGWREPFPWQEPASWKEIADLGELAQAILEDPRIHAALMLLANRERAQKLYPWHDGLHTPPAAEHYRHTYLWDSGFVEMMLAQAAWLCAKGAELLESRLSLEGGEPKVVTSIGWLHSYAKRFQRAGIEEGFSVVKAQRADGFIPNLQYGEGTLWYEVEKHLSIDRVNKSSNYTQPPVLPLATYATYRSMRETDDPNANTYLSEMYPYQDRFMRYFHDYRSNSDTDVKIGVIEPHETGLDSLEQWDYIKPGRLARNGAETKPNIDAQNRFADGAHFVLRLVERRFVAKGDLAKERELFWCMDVMMNSIYLHNLRVMCQLANELGKTDDIDFYGKLADTLETQITADMWQDDSKKVPMPGFYSLKADGEPVPTLTISNLFALTLPHLPEAKLAAMLDMMDEHFDVPYPLPSGSTKSPNYDPNNQEKDRLWRGPTWINTSWYITEHGLLVQAARSDIRPDLINRCQQWAKRITEASNKLLDMNEPAEPVERELAAKVVDLAIHREADHQELVTGAWEHYNPHTGEGQRPRVRNFAWSWLARFMTLADQTARDKAA